MDHAREVHILQEIAKAMTFVIENNVHFIFLSQESIDIIDQWSLELVSNVLSGFPLKISQYWNVESLENYIQMADIFVLSGNFMGTFSY